MWFAFKVAKFNQEMLQTQLIYMMITSGWKWKIKYLKSGPIFHLFLTRRAFIYSPSVHKSQTLIFLMLWTLELLKMRTI